MRAFISYSEALENILHKIVGSSLLHAKWLNTLSFLENCGARMIAACEHPILVKEEMLKHAAEEFRHAHHLKRQIARVPHAPLSSYSKELMLASKSTMRYLTTLNIKTSRYLKAVGLSKSEIKEAAYLLVTYAIERRASELYPVYDAMLRGAKSRVAVKSILLEEKEHLAEMEEGLRGMQEGAIHAQKVMSIESALCKEWISSLQAELDGIS